MTKVVLKLELRDDKDKQKAMKTVSSLSGVESVAMDMKDKKLTVVGEIDPVRVAAKLRKFCHTEIVTVGPSKEPEKKKDEPKKEDQKKKDEPKKDDVAELVKAYQAYYNHHPPMPTYHYYRSQEGYPYYNRGQEEENGCVIC